MHDENAPVVSEVCRANLRRVKTSALVAGTIWVILATFVIAAYALDA